MVTIYRSLDPQRAKVHMWRKCRVCNLFVGCLCCQYRSGKVRRPVWVGWGRKEGLKDFWQPQHVSRKQSSEIMQIHRFSNRHKFSLYAL